MGCACLLSLSPEGYGPLFAPIKPHEDSYLICCYPGAKDDAFFTFVARASEHEATSRE